MTLQQGSKLYHNSDVKPVELVKFVEDYRGEKIWLVKDVPGSMTHIMRFNPKDVITPYKEAK